MLCSTSLSQLCQPRNHKNNTLGTLVVAEEALRAKVASFTLISTDKAVNPTNVIGHQLNQYMNPGQISRMFKSVAVKANLDPDKISGHPMRVGAAQDLLIKGYDLAAIMRAVSCVAMATPKGGNAGPISYNGKYI